MLPRIPGDHGLLPRPAIDGEAPIFRASLKRLDTLHRERLLPHRSGARHSGSVSTRAIKVVMVLVRVLSVGLAGFGNNSLDLRRIKVPDERQAADGDAPRDRCRLTLITGRAMYAV